MVQRNQKVILVVDDDESVTSSMSLMLKQQGYLSKVAYGPEQALKLLENQRFDLIIQDMNFSRKTSGEEGMALLKSLTISYPEIPVLLMTAWGSISLAVSGIREGARDFITKPWDNQRLLQTIATTLSLSESKSEDVLSRHELVV